MSKGISSASFDTQLSALSHIDRRRLLLALFHAETEDDALPLEVDLLEHDTAGNTLQLSMNHVHLPKLDEHGFVEANPDRGSVTIGPRFDEIEPLLELLDENRDRLPDDWL
ncbi:DUF7344 domain-containing protein [Halobaculum magnesiiphilum]|uniref:DUF7344 domain-containing protein n=1 Tax=Halobaculum magnesiiphilum TaxID=1017351 RepID=UPI003CE4D6C2